MSEYSTIIINIAYVFILLSYMAHNIVLLRILGISGSGFLILWASLYVPYPDLVSIIAWNGVFILINLGYIVKYLFNIRSAKILNSQIIPSDNV